MVSIDDAHRKNTQRAVTLNKAYISLLSISYPMSTSRITQFFARPHIQLLLLSLAAIIWGENFASREVLTYDDASHWFWPNVYGYMSAVLLVEAIIYWLSARFLQWPWLQHLHVGTMLTFGLMMWLFEMAGENPGDPVLPLSHTFMCISEYLLLAGHLAFFTHITAGLIIGRKILVTEGR